MPKIVGYTHGTFIPKEGGLGINYSKVFVSEPFPLYQNDTAVKEGMQVKIHKCVSSDVLSGFYAGDDVELYFDSRGRVSLISHSS